MPAPLHHLTLLVDETKGGKKERMLTMAQIQNIRFLKNHKDMSLRSIAKETNHHFETVKKYVEKEDFNLQLREKQHRKGKLDPYKQLIDQWLTDDLLAKPKQRHTAKRIYDRLREQYGDEFNVSDRSVRAYVSKRRPEIFQGTDKGHIPLEHSPGEAQADFGAAQFIERGTLYDGFYLTISFPYSNGGYTQLFKSENQECLLEGLKSIFEHIGGSPREFNRQLLKKCDEDMQRNHYRKPGTIAQLFEEDKKVLNPLPAVPYEVYRLERVKADNYGKVKFDNKRYSSSPAFAGCQLWLKVGAFEVTLLDDKYHQIIKHPRLYGQQNESMQWAPYLELMARRPRAIKHTGFFKELPLKLQDYLAKCDLAAQRAALQILTRMTKNSDLPTATSAFIDTLERGLSDPDSIWSNFVRLTSGSYEPKPAELPPKVPEVKPYQVDTSIYDHLLNGGSKWKQ